MRLRDGAPWTPVADALPPSGQVVQVRTPGGDVRSLIFEVTLWWLPDRSMYVYFTPTHWRPIAPAPEKKK